MASVRRASIDANGAKRLSAFFTLLNMAAKAVLLSVASASLLGGGAYLLYTPSVVLVEPPVDYSIRIENMPIPTIDHITKQVLRKTAIVSWTSITGKVYSIERRDSISDWTRIVAIESSLDGPLFMPFFLGENDSETNWRVVAVP